MLRNFMLSNVTFTVLSSIHFLANDMLATALQLLAIWQRFPSVYIYHAKYRSGLHLHSVIA